MKFSETLLQFRKAQGLSQETLAEKVGVSRQAVSKWETGEALPDLQKAVLLSEALGVSLDLLCGKEGSPAAAEPPAARKRRAFPFLLAAICLCAGLLMGSLIPALRPEPPAMPETITVSAVRFFDWDINDNLTCRFIPSVAGDGYTYRVTFIKQTGEALGFDAVCSDGVCTAAVQLPPYGSRGIGYTVVVAVSNGVETRTIPLDGYLALFDHRVIWETP